MNLPNKITIARIIFVPLMIISPFIADYAEYKETVLYGLPVVNLILLVIFLIASLTDFLDGYIARKRNLVTNFGKFLDPIADKLLVFTALIILVEMGIIPSWIPIIIAFREFMVSGIRMISASEGVVISASKLGKIKTVTQMIAISFGFLDINPFLEFTTTPLTGFLLVLNVLMTISMFVCVITTLWSGIDYFVKSKDVLLKSK